MRTVTLVRCRNFRGNISCCLTAKNTPLGENRYHHHYHHHHHPLQHHQYHHQLHHHHHHPDTTITISTTTTNVRNTGQDVEILRVQIQIQVCAATFSPTSLVSKSWTQYLVLRGETKKRNHVYSHRTHVKDNYHCRGKFILVKLCGHSTNRWAHIKAGSNNLCQLTGFCH